MNRVAIDSLINNSLKEAAMIRKEWLGQTDSDPLPDNKQIAKAIQKGGKEGKYARDYLVLSHVRLAVYLAKTQFPVQFAEKTEDVTQCAILGLSRAANRYNGTQMFSTYAKFYVIHELSDYASLLAHSTQHYAALQKKVLNFIKEAREKGEPFPSVRKISEGTGLSIRAVRNELTAYSISVVSLDAMGQAEGCMCCS